MYEQNVGKLTNTRCIYIHRPRNDDGINIVKIHSTRQNLRFSFIVGMENKTSTECESSPPQPNSWHDILKRRSDSGECQLREDNVTARDSLALA